MIPQTGAIALSALQTEFGGQNSVSMSEYYAGKKYVPQVAPSIPNSGQVSVSQYRGRSNSVLVTPNYPVNVLGTVNVLGPWTGAIAVAGWPDAGSQWIWNSAGAEAGAAWGVNVNMQAAYYNSSGADQAGTLYGAVDNTGTCYLNNVAVLSVPSWTTTASVGVTLTPGYNLITMIGLNAGTSINPAGALCCLYVGGSLVLRTDSSWTYY
jgi:hypothetical protein